MDFRKEIQGLEEVDVIRGLHKEELPLVMWGAGSSAPEVDFYLKKNGITISDVFVDDEYYEEGLLYDGKQVLSYSMLKEKYSFVNVILGNSHYEKKRQLEQEACIAKVYCLFSISYHIFEKTPVIEIEQHISEFEEVYRLLEDAQSKKSLMAFIKARVSGNNKYVMEAFQQEANFFHNDIYKISGEEVYLDVGAFNGDTIRLFIRENGRKYKYIYALEPDEQNYASLEQYVKGSRLENIEIQKIGAWKQKDVLCFSSAQKQVSGILTQNPALATSMLSHITAMPLDLAFQYRQKVTLMKINYLEGVKEAVEGATEILKEHRPKLAIAVGFDCRNIRCIPGLVKKIHPGYQLYLRFNRGMVSGLTLYGVAVPSDSERK